MIKYIQTPRKGGKTSALLEAAEPYINVLFIGEYTHINTSDYDHIHFRKPVDVFDRKYTTRAIPNGSRFQLILIDNTDLLGVPTTKSLLEQVMPLLKSGGKIIVTSTSDFKQQIEDHIQALENKKNNITHQQQTLDTLKNNLEEVDR